MFCLISLSLVEIDLEILRNGPEMSTLLFILVRTIFRKTQKQILKSFVLLQPLC